MNDVYINRYNVFSGHMTICAQCGYRFVRGDETLTVKETGDVIHKSCWMDYSEDNRDELCEETDFWEV